MTDPYLLENATLRNKLGLTDQAALSQAEAVITASREAELRACPFPASLRMEELRRIHRHLFQDVYDWAGQYRTTDLRKDEDLTGSTTSHFVSHVLIGQAAAGIDARLERDDFLRGLAREDFIAAAADLFVAINRLHPFREGNGRTQRVFLARLAKSAGHLLNFDVVTGERMVAVSIAGHQGDVPAVARLFDEISDPMRIKALSKAFAFLRRTNAAWNDLYVATTVTGQVYEGRVAARDPDATGGFVLWSTIQGNRLLVGASGDLDAETEPDDDVGFTAGHFGPP